jgi:hypothetical protein
MRQRISRRKLKARIKRKREGGAAASQTTGKSSGQAKTSGAGAPGQS